MQVDAQGRRAAREGAEEELVILSIVREAEVAEPFDDARAPLEEAWLDKDVEVAAEIGEPAGRLVEDGMGPR